MPKKRTSRPGAKPSSKTPNTDTEPGAFQSLGKRIDEIPTVQSAEEMVAKAQAELAKAQEHYHRVRGEAVEQLHGLREASLSDMAATAMRFVRKHPGQGVLLSTLLGFFLGRLFRR